MSFPSVSEAFWGWTNPVQLQIVTTTVGDYETTEVPNRVVIFDGVLEPLHPRNLLIKPEGQRTWKWWDLWTKETLELNSIIADESGKQYRVMSIGDWHDATYRKYELVQNPPLGS